MSDIDLGCGVEKIVSIDLYTVKGSTDFMLEG